MAIESLRPTASTSHAAFGIAHPRSAAEAYRLCKEVLASIGDSAFVLHEILLPLVPDDAASLSTLRQRMLANIPQDGAQTNLLNACLPDDPQILWNILDKLIGHFS